MTRIKNTGKIFAYHAEDKWLLSNICKAPVKHNEQKKSILSNIGGEGGKSGNFLKKGMR